jgi:hypothetical protein
MLPNDKSPSFQDILQRLSIEALEEYNRMASICKGPFPYTHFFYSDNLATKNQIVFYQDKAWMWSLPEATHFCYSILYHPSDQTTRIGFFDSERRQQGYGFVKMATATYEGDFVNNLYHGTGSCRNNDPTTATITYCESASWHKGQLQGHVKIIYSNKDIYIGDYQNNQPHGKGTMKFHTKTTYTGTFSFGKATGFAYIYYNNGDIYKGQCVNGLPHGFGIILYNDGDTFTGNWVDGFSQRTKPCLNDFIFPSLLKTKKKKNKNDLNLSSLSQETIKKAIDKILLKV